jgi:hypothetical protein
MKKFFCVSLAFSLCFVLVGCIDIFQHITRDTNGVDQNQIKVTVSKTVLAMANSLSDSDDIDYEELFDASDMNTMDIDEYKQFAARVSKVNDLMDIGYLIDMNINYKDRNTLNKINSTTTSFIPKYEGKTVKIHIDALGDSSATDNNMAAAFLATGKYRLLIDKKCVTNIKEVVLKTNDGENTIGFLDLHTEYLIEIPIPIIFMSAVDLIIYSN